MFAGAKITYKHETQHFCITACGRYWANTFGREGSLHVLGSRFNHSCVPNCTPAETSSSTASATETPRTFLTLRPVARGEELTLSYLPSKLGAMGAVIRRRHLWLSRGFLCNCTLCSEGQDYLRRVRCPDCASRRHPQPSHVPSGRCRSSGETGSASVGSGLRAEPPGGAETEEVFADWWSRSNMWVCRWCGWCSDPNGALHRREAALSAEVFSFVMAKTLVEDRLPLPLGEGGLGAGCNGISGTRAPRESHDGRRSSIEDMLRASVRILGRRHWVTFCCLLMRLELDMVLLESSNASLLAPTPPVNLDRASRELEGLWLWLELAPLVLAPEYYLFDLVCSVAVVGLGRAGALWSAADELLSRVGTWASVFADGHQRKKLQTSRAVVLRNLNER